MRIFSSCFLLCSCAAWAQDLPYKHGVTSWPVPVGQAASIHKLPDRIAMSDNGAYVSAMLGNGRAYGGNTMGERSMKGRAMSVRLGKGLASFGGPSVFSDSEKMRADFVYYNEGHPDNNHRDGFAAQLVYSNALHRDVTAEFGAGPYLSMNTTKINGVQINDSNLGALLLPPCASASVATRKTFMCGSR
jgi:hypothetical protein